MLAGGGSARFQYGWPGRAVAAFGFVVALEVALYMFPGSSDISIHFTASNQFAILRLAVLLVGIFAWNACDRSAIASNKTVQTIKPSPEGRHMGIMQEFSEQLGFGTIACIDEDDWPGSDSVRIYDADKKRLGLETGDVVAFHLLLDRQANDGSYRAVNIRYAYDCAPTSPKSSSNRQGGQRNSQMCDAADCMQQAEATYMDKCAAEQCDTVDMLILDHSPQQTIDVGLDTLASVFNGNSCKQQVEATCTDKGAMGQCDAIDTLNLNHSPHQTIDAGLDTPACNFNDNSSTPLKNGQLDDHQESSARQDDENRFEELINAEQVPSTRLGNSSTITEIAPTAPSISGMPVHSFDRFGPDQPSLLLQRMATDHECESNVDLDTDEDATCAAAPMKFAALGMEVSLRDANTIKLPHAGAEVSSSQASSLLPHEAGLRSITSDPVVLTMKNTFLHVENDLVSYSRMKRSASDSELSTSLASSSSGSSSTFTADKKSLLWEKGASGGTLWLPKLLPDASDSQSFADGPEPPNINNVLIATVTNAHVTQSDANSFWFRSHQRVYAESSACSGQCSKPSFVDGLDGYPSSNQEMRQSDSYITNNGTESFRPAPCHEFVTQESDVRQHDVRQHDAPMDSVRNARTDTSLVMQLHEETGTPIEDLQHLHYQGILQQIPRNDDGEFTSVGSIGHQFGECRGCIFWFRKSCAKGVNCTFCHFEHAGQKHKRIRPSKSTRLRMRIESERQEEMP